MPTGRRVYACLAVPFDERVHDAHEDRGRVFTRGDRSDLRELEASFADDKPMKRGSIAYEIDRMEAIAPRDATEPHAMNRGHGVDGRDSHR